MKKVLYLPIFCMLFALLSSCTPQSTERVVHIVPEEDSLRIGGCWNKAVASEKCGQFVVQLDSDDIYSRPDTLQKMV